MEKPESFKELEILLVDDDDIISFLHGELFEQNGIPFKRKIFLNGKTAWEHILQNREGRSFLVFLDLTMPVMDGWGFLDKLKEQGDQLDVAVVVVTSSCQVEEKRRAESYPHVERFHQKPLNSEFLQEIFAEDNWRSWVGY